MNASEVGIDPIDASSEGALSALSAVINALRPLDDETRQRVIDSATTFLGLRRARTSQPEVSGPAPERPSVSHETYPPFSADTAASPKEFMLEKEPRTDVERIACLAYYLTHYRDTPHFKTLDLSKLNTEAAQPKFSNAASSSNNAVKRGYLVSSTKGHRQLSAAGERFVQVLPDRDAARLAMASIRPHRRKPRSTKASGKKTPGEGGL